MWADFMWCVKNISCVWYSFKTERCRFKEWKLRHGFDGKQMSWLEAIRATVDNPVSFDISWDYEMEGKKLEACGSSLSKESI